MSAATLASGISACALISGLNNYARGECPADGCDSGLDEGGSSSGGGTFETGGMMMDTGFAGPDVSEGTGPQDATEAACTGGPTICAPVSSATKYACTVGGCNAASGTCSSSGQACYCTANAACLSGKCVKTAGQNDVSCGSQCTGSGPPDGFGCALTSPGIPTISHAIFGYTPSNFSPANYTPPQTATVINFNPTYDAGAHSFSGWGSGQQPTITSSVAQSGGPAVDILAFGDLTINAGNTLTITGGNAVILAVYGAANIQGAIHVDGTAGAPSSSSAGASGPGGNYSCGSHAGQSSGDTNDDGGGGGGASTSGAAGGAGVNGIAGAAGTARANASLVPLYGGCPGGNSGSWACTTSGGGGGGAVQISAAGPLTVTGTITANGGAGGTSSGTACSTTQALCGGTVYPGGGGGGGSGGAILLEGQSVTATGGTVTVNGGKGGNPQAGSGAGGAGGTSSAAAGAGTGSAGACGSATQAGGGGGGGYGYYKTTTGSAPSYTCTTTLSPAPVSNAAHTACLCVADSDCASGKCVNANSQCTGSCTGTGMADGANCALVTAAATAWSCSNGNCSTVTSSTGTCSASGTPCWCTSDSQCSGGRCASWAGCGTGACSATGSGDAFHCVP